MNNEYDYGQTAEPIDDSKESLFEDCPECGDYSSSQPGVEGCTSSSCSRFMGDQKLKDYIKRAGYKTESKPTSPPNRGNSRSIDVSAAMSGPTLFDMLDKIPGHGSHHHDGEPDEQPPSTLDRVLSGEYDVESLGNDGYGEEDKKPSREDDSGDFLPGDDYKPPF